MTAKKRDELVLRILERIQTDLGDLKSDVGTLKGDVATLKDDVAMLKDDVASLKSDLSALEVATVVGFRLVIDRIDQHRNFAIDLFRQHARRLEKLESRR